MTSIPDKDVYLLVSPAADLYVDYMPAEVLDVLPPEARRRLGRRRGPAIICFRTHDQANAHLKSMPPGWSSRAVSLVQLCSGAETNGVPAILVRGESGWEDVLISGANRPYSPPGMARKRIDKGDANPDLAIAFRHDGPGCRFIVPGKVLAAAGLLGKGTIIRALPDASPGEKSLSIVRADHGIQVPHRLADSESVIFSLPVRPEGLDDAEDGDYFDPTIFSDFIRF